MGDRLAAWVEAVVSRVFGPVFALDATRVGRRMSTFIARWVYLFILVSILTAFFYSWWRDLRAPGGVVHPGVLTRFAEEFFWVYIVTQFFAVTALTPAFTAAAITDEKERKTLDFLLITDLTGREIVFGKLAVRFGVLLTLVLAGLPILAFMQFFGGIEPRLLFLTVGMTLMTVISLSGISICASVLLSRTRDAVMFSYGLPAAYVFLSLLGLNYLFLTEWSEWAKSFAMGNPLFVGARLDRAFSTTGTPQPAIQYLVFHGVVGALGFAIAALRLRSCAEGRGTPGSKPRGAFRRFIAWALAHRTEARPHPPVSDQPVLWREVYVDPGSTSGLVSRLFAIVLLAAIVLPFLGIVYDALSYDARARARFYGYTYSAWYYFKERIQVWVCLVTAGLGIIMMLRATIRGASAVAGERDRDTWISLLSTPLSTRDILYGKWAGCVWGQRGLMYLLGGVWAIGVLTVSVTFIPLVFAAGALWVYLTTCAWLGIRCSVTARNTRAAISRAVPIAIFVGGGYWFFLGCCCMGIGFRGGGEAIANLGGFVLGATPPFVLGGLPAVDAELFEHLGRRDASMFLAMLVGGVVGIGGWFGAGRALQAQSQEMFDVEANRTRSEQRPALTPPRAEEEDTEE